jgi:hypothetical protein
MPRLRSCIKENAVTRLHLRSLSFAALLLMLTIVAPAPLVAAPQDFRWDPASRAYTVTNQTPNNTVLVVSDFRLRNDDTTAATFVISFPEVPGGWQASTTIAQPIAVNQATTSAVIPIRIIIPPNTPNGVRTVTVRATRTDVTPNQTAEAVIQVTLVAPAPGTPPPSACPELSDPGNNFDGAALILVDRAERHGICTVGDEDWYKFGAVAGKYYSIDIPDMDAGLDLSLELYDSNRRLVDSNDDFPFRGGAQTLTDTRPLIQSFRAPTNGFFYVRVRDTLGIGGSNLSYTIIVRGESYGPFPPFVSSLCNDIYEQDGLPELARQINQNETQRGRLLCPNGDADWVKFFALAGYTYYLYTNTRPYAPPDANGVLPGADTLLFLFGRDAITLIDSNNNIEGGTTLDSLVRFTPSADGIYYAQIKNVGDIGGMFIRYDLTLKACPVEQPACAPPPDILPAPPQATVAVVPLAQEVAPLIEASGAPQSVPALVEDASGEMIVALAGAQPIARQIDPSFIGIWQRVDLPVTTGRAKRAWVWGPAPRLARSEPYIQSSTGLRQVLYFDKGRLEINNPAGDRSAASFVTAGLLVSEMVMGQVQIGDGEYMAHQPAMLPVVGDLDGANAPTYAMFSALASPVADRTGLPVSEALLSDGSVRPMVGPARPETRIAHFVAATGHNIPRIFWEYLTASGVVYDNGTYRAGRVLDWVAVVGYPISEAYWVRVRVGGVERDVLVQLFERRVLTYTPDEQPMWRVQMGNVGQHYYIWRYGSSLP